MVGAGWRQDHRHDFAEKSRRAFYLRLEVSPLICNLSKTAIKDTNAVVEVLLFDIERWSQHNRIAHGRPEAQALTQGPVYHLFGLLRRGRAVRPAQGQSGEKSRSAHERALRNRLKLTAVIVRSHNLSIGTNQ
jgi:hypothetical protein